MILSNRFQEGRILKNCIKFKIKGEVGTPKKTKKYYHKIVFSRDFPRDTVDKNTLINAGRMQSLVQKDYTCHKATKPMHHNYWTQALEPMSSNHWDHNSWSLCILGPTKTNETMWYNCWSPCTIEPAHCSYRACLLQLLKPILLEPVLHKRSNHNEKSLCTATE